MKHMDFISIKYGTNKTTVEGLKTTIVYSCLSCTDLKDVQNNLSFIHNTKSLNGQLCSTRIYNDHPKSLMVWLMKCDDKYKLPWFWVVLGVCNHFWKSNISFSGCLSSPSYLTGKKEQS